MSSEQLSTRILSEQAKTVFSSSSTAPIDFFELGVIPAGTDDGHFTHELVLEFISNDGSTMTKKEINETIEKFLQSDRVDKATDGDETWYMVVRKY